MEDSRYKQILEEIQLESDTTGSMYAFTGFGRSTESVQKKEEVQALGQQRINALNQVIALEAQARAGDDVREALSMAQTQLYQLGQEAQKRRTELSMRLSNVGSIASQKIQKLFSLKGSYIQKRPSFKLRKPQIPKLGSAKIKPLKTVMATGKMEKLNFSPLKSMSRITSYSRLQSFGSHQTLSGFNA